MLVSDTCVINAIQMATVVGTLVDGISVHGNEQEFLDILVHENYVAFNTLYSSDEKPRIVIYDEEPMQVPIGKNILLHTMDLCDYLIENCAACPEWEDTVAYRLLTETKKRCMFSLGGVILD